MTADCLQWSDLHEQHNDSRGKKPQTEPVPGLRWATEKKL